MKKKKKFVITANPNPCSNNRSQRIRHFYSFDEATDWLYAKMVKDTPTVKRENIKNRLTNAIYNDAVYANWKWHIFKGVE